MGIYIYLHVNMVFYPLTVVPIGLLYIINVKCLSVTQFRLLSLMPCALLEAAVFWQDTAFLSWKLLRDWARLALWGRTWWWWSREFTPFLCLTAPLGPSSSSEFPPGPPRLLLQRKAKPGTVGLADNWRPSEAFGLSLHAKREWKRWITFYLSVSFCTTK